MLLALTACAAARPPPAPSTTRVGGELDRALVGEWVGVLEYRDYAEPPGSTKRVRLPTWLSITLDGEQQRWHYTYDDGPGKTVEEVDLVTIGEERFIEQQLGKPARTYSLSGLANLHGGVGSFELRGEGTDNDQPAEQRVTFSIGRNALDLVQDTRLTSAGGDAPFVFRHAYHFTRARRPGLPSQPSAMAARAR